MPEEINRIVTDSISDYFFVTEEGGIKNLLKENKPADIIETSLRDPLYKQSGTYDVK